MSSEDLFGGDDENGPNYPLQTSCSSSEDESQDQSPARDVDMSVLFSKRTKRTIVTHSPHKPQEPNVEKKSKLSRLNTSGKPVLL